MSTGALCQRCRAAVLDRYLCPRCETRLADTLRDVPVALDELDTTLARLGRQPGASTTTDTAPVIDESVSVVAASLRGACIGWAGLLGYVGPVPWLWLWQQTEHIATSCDQAGNLATDLDRRVAAAWRKVDRPEARWYAGVCGAAVIDASGCEYACARTLWASLDEAVITCPACRTRWPVEQRRDHLLRVAAEHVDTVARVASLVSLVTRVRVTRQRIGMWVTRGRLTPLPRLDDQQPARVRVADVLALLDQPDDTDTGTDAPEGITA